MEMQQLQLTGNTVPINMQQALELKEIAVRYKQDFLSDDSRAWEKLRGINGFVDYVINVAATQGNLADSNSSS